MKIHSLDKLNQLLTNILSALFADSSGNIGINEEDPCAKLDINSSGIGVLVGADNGATTRTDATVKMGQIAQLHYTLSEKPLGLIEGYCDTLGSGVYLGGGRSAVNAATEIRFYTAGNTTTPLGTCRMTVNKVGTVNVVGTFTAGTKTFVIDHPVEPTEKILTHAVFEGPEHGLIYRGKTNLVAGIVTINFDQYFNMAPGTFAALTQDVTVQSLQNQDGFDRIKPGEITPNSFEIICEDNKSTDEIAWVVIAARADKLIKFSTQNDENGRLILETEKPDLTDDDLAILDTPLEIETTDRGKNNIEEVVNTDALNSKKGYFMHPEAHGKPMPTMTVKHKYQSPFKSKKAKELK